MGEYFKAPNINGVTVPYEAGVKELKNGLNGKMEDYVVCLRALAWKEDRESFRILKNELRNKDYYRRRAALENISYHKYWKASPELLRELLLDHSEYVVKLALGLLNTDEDCEVTSEVVAAYDFWQGNPEIEDACRKYFERKNVDYNSLVRQLNDKKRKMLEDEEFYRACSQRKPMQNWNENEKISEYRAVVQQYFPDYSLDDVRLILNELSEEGCGYAAVAATLTHFFQRYCYEFGNIFGFPLYDGGIRSNADILMLHFYCMTYQKGHGMTIGQMMGCFREFTRAYHLKAKMDILWKVDSKKLNEAGAYIIILAKEFSLLDCNRKKVFVEEWHYMNLRGIDEEGNFMVLSWGESYMLRKADITGRVHFLRVRYAVPV